MKLGYIYTVTSGGYDDEKVRVNDGGWSSIVEDERQTWLKYSVDNECLAMSIIDQGLVLAVSHIIGGDRADNNVTTWIFIPSKIKISGNEILKVISAIREINNGGIRRVTTESFTQNVELNKDYPEKDHVAQFKGIRGNAFAFRNPNTDFTMAEILGTPYQTYYLNYKHIFLYNRPGVAKAELTDLSNKDIIESIVALPFSQPSLENTFGRSRVEVFLSNGDVFKKPMLVSKNQTLDLQIEKAGCVPMKVKAQAIEDEKELEILSIQSWQRILSKKSFKVYDKETNREITNFKVRITDKHYDQENHSIPEDYITAVDVQVCALGYTNYEGKVDLSSGFIRIAMGKIIEKAKYTLYRNNGTKLTINIEGPGAQSQKPIDGYHLIGANLHPNSRSIGFAWKEFCYGIATVLIVLLSAWGVVKLFEQEEAVETPEQEEAVETDDRDRDVNAEDIVANQDRRTPPPEELNLSPAIKYLDNNAVWHRESLEKYPELVGLFDELNQYQFDKILNRAEKLNSSEKFKLLLDVISQIGGIDKPGKYLGEGEHGIDISNYIGKINDKYLDTQHVTGTQTQQGANTASPEKPSKKNQEGQRGSVKVNNNQQ